MLFLKDVRNMVNVYRYKYVETCIDLIRIAITQYLRQRSIQCNDSNVFICFTKIQVKYKFSKPFWSIQYSISKHTHFHHIFPIWSQYINSHNQTRQHRNCSVQQHYANEYVSLVGSTTHQLLYGLGKKACQWIVL